MVPRVPGATRTTLGFVICPSFKDHSLSRRAEPWRHDSHIFASLYDPARRRRRQEPEDREEDRSLLHALEEDAAQRLPFPWDGELSADLLDNLGKYRKYDWSSVRDLLRVLRNKRCARGYVG
jgi:hypothetical protein